MGTALIEFIVLSRYDQWQANEVYCVLAFPTCLNWLSTQEAREVKQADVSLESGIAKVELQAPSYFDAWNQLLSLVNVVTELGFEAEPHFLEPEESSA